MAYVVRVYATHRNQSPDGCSAHLAGRADRVGAAIERAGGETMGDPVKVRGLDFHKAAIREKIGWGVLIRGVLIGQCTYGGGSTEVDVVLNSTATDKILMIEPQTELGEMFCKILKGEW